MDINSQAAICENLLKRKDNNFCADCTSKIPRWASINFGVFICIRCSGKYSIDFLSSKIWWGLRKLNSLLNLMMEIFG